MSERTGRLIGIAWKEKPRQPMREAERTSVTLEAGLTGDFRGAPGDRQVTVVFAADWRAACAQLGEERSWTLRRANLLVDGLANPCAAGRTLQIGDVVLQITGETAPCANMDRQWPGLTAALNPNWRGGVTTRVLSGGVLRLGDEVSFSR
jgi:MOSC domain-containing protein YiiM